MIDVFTEQHEVLIKDGIANLYWYRGDLQKAWQRAGVPQHVCQSIWAFTREDGQPLSKRQCMDKLYEKSHGADFNLRLRISREFVRILIEHSNFVPQSDKHRIDVAERAALKLREVISSQEAARDQNARDRRIIKAKEPPYEQLLEKIREDFVAAQKSPAQDRGYSLEKIFADLVRISGLAVEGAFSLKGEQIDGAIKHEGIYYIVELKWHAKRVQPNDIGAFHFKVEGRLGTRGIFLAMNDYTDNVLTILPRGKDLRVLLLDGVHLANVVYGQYRFSELLNHALRHASLKGEPYCPHQIGGA